MTKKDEFAPGFYLDPPPAPETPLPQCGAAGACGRADCPAPNFEAGYGFAAGGLGAYEWCEACGKFVSATFDD